MGPVCTPGSVTVPCANTAWDIGAQALYLQPVYNSAFDYVSATLPVASNTTNYQNFGPSWGWGFQIEGSYHFNTGNDLDINWYHMHHDSNSTLPVTVASVGYNNVDSMGSNWDAVNAEFGQVINFGELQKTRIHAGVQYARIATPINVSSIIAASNVTVGGASANSLLNAFGPRVGSDMYYDVGNGFSVYGKAAAAILVGTSQFNATNTTTNNTPLNYTSGSKTAIVPNLEGKLGVKYTCAVAQGDLTGDIGWMWENYFNAQDVNYNVGGDLGPNIANVQESAFALQGLYFGLKWMGNV